MNSETDTTTVVVPVVVTDKDEKESEVKPVIDTTTNIPEKAEVEQTPLTAGTSKQSLADLTLSSEKEIMESPEATQNSEPATLEIPPVEELTPTQNTISTIPYNQKTISQNQPQSSKKYLPMEVYVTVVAAFSFLCIGLQRAYTSPALESMKEDHEFFNRGLSKTTISWFAASPPLGSFFGTILSGLALQYCGRQKTLVLLTIPYIGGFLLIGFAKNVPMLMTGRVLTGLAAGFSTAAAQLYVSECVRAKVRGFLGFVPAMMLSLGILLGFAMSTINLEWQDLALLMTSFPILLFLFAIAVPESPSWLLYRGKEKEAIESLKKLRGVEDDDHQHPQHQLSITQGDGGNGKGQPDTISKTTTKANPAAAQLDEEIEKEIEEMRRVMRRRQSLTKPTPTGDGDEEEVQQDFVQFVFKELLGKREIWFPAFVSASLMVFQQFTGANAIIYYLSLILNEATPTFPNSTFAFGHGGHPSNFHSQSSNNHHSNRHGLDPNVSSVIVGLVQFFAFFLSLPMIDRLGRRVLLIVSALLMIFPHLVLGIYFYVKLNPTNYIHVYKYSSIIKYTSSWLPLTCLCAFIGAYSIGFGPIPFIIMSEIFPSSARSYMCALASLVNHLTLFFIVRIFPTLMDWFGPHIMFWMFAVFCFLAAIHVLIVVPETKGKTLAEIELEFLGKNRRNSQDSSSSSDDDGDDKKEDKKSSKSKVVNEKGKKSEKEECTCKCKK